jgi:hypothetical protein
VRLNAEFIKIKVFEGGQMSFPEYVITLRFSVIEVFTKLNKIAGSSLIGSLVRAIKQSNLSMAAGIVGVVLCSLPFYVSILPPINDFSQHVLVARIINDYNDPLFRFSDYFVIEWHLAPAMLFYLVLAVMQKVFGYFWDARVYLTLWIIALWLSVWYLSKVRGNSNPWLPALLVLPLAFNWYVYGGALPFLMTIPLFTLTVAIWEGVWKPIVKISLMWILFLLLFGFHIVGAAAAAAVILIIATYQVFIEKKPFQQLTLAIISVLPAPALAGIYLFGGHAPNAKIEYGSFLTQVIDVIKFTSSSLDDLTAGLLLLWLALLGFIAVFRWRDLIGTGQMIVSIAFLLALSIAMPRTLGSLWPAGPRLIPFVIVLFCATVPWSKSHKLIVVTLSVLLIAGMSFTTVRHTIEIDKGYRDYLSAANIVQPGKSILPILVDPHESSKWTAPYWFLISAYTVMRGGANPYVFADPHVQTGASPLRYRRPSQDRKYAFLYDDINNSQAVNYKGVSCCYDYILLWGVSPEIEAVLGNEMKKVHAQGKGTLFARN